MFQLNNVPSARKCQAQSRHHPRRRRKVCHVRLGTRPWYASRATTRRSGGEESQRAGGEHERGATARTAKRNDGHTHRAGPPEGRANATARDDTARDDTDVTSVHARTSSTHAPQRRVAGPTRPNRARGLFWCALSRGGASEGRIGAVVARVGNQRRCRLGLKGGASVGWWCGSGREPCVGSRPGLLSGKSAVESDISKESIRQGRDSIQRVEKRPETI